MSLDRLDPELLTAPHAQLARAYLTAPGLPDRRLAAPESLQVTFDALRAPRVVAEVTLPAPATPADAAYTDHRQGARLVVEAGYRLTDGEVLLGTLADLQVRDRVLNRPPHTVTVTAAGAEALVLDRPHHAAYTLPAGMPLVTVVRTVLDLALGAGTYTLTADPTVTYPLPAALDVPAAADPFDLLETLTDAAGAYLYADELGAWWLTPEPTPGTPAVQLHTGDGGTLTELQADLTRDLYATEVLLVHEWTDTDARRIVGRGRVLPAADGPARRTRVVRRSTPVAQGTAAAAAVELARRLQLAAGGLLFTAVADYRLRPGATVEVLDELTGATVQLLTSVTFDLSTGLMTCSTRDATDLGS